MAKILIILVVLIGILAVGFFGLEKFYPAQVEQSSSRVASAISQTQSKTVSPTLAPIASSSAVTNDQLLTLASNKYANGNLPLGDNRYVTDGPKKGYIYLCHANSDPSGGGAQINGPWIHGNTWNIKEKISVTGQKFWQSAQFSNSISGSSRTVTGNDIPSHATGNFPIQSTDPAYKYDKNPNSIKEQSFTNQLPVSPSLTQNPNCMGGEVGIMLTGVPLFNGFDAGLRDAAAHEIQDSCQGHPQVSGEYHYHSLSSCIKDVSVQTVIGFALDGFPITGPSVDKDKYLTTDNLDECHGITSEINLDGKKVTSYHYVMTEDFPYSVSCFKGKPASMQVIQSSQNQSGPNQSIKSQNGPDGRIQPSGMPPPPPNGAPPPGY